MSKFHGGYHIHNTTLYDEISSENISSYIIVTDAKIARGSYVGNKRSLNHWKDERIQPTRQKHFPMVVWSIIYGFSS